MAPRTDRGTMTHRVHAWHPPHAEAVGALAYQPPKKPWYQSRWVIAATLVVAFVWVIAL